MNHVTSADGTTIGYQTRGGGPALILVSTALDDRHALDGLAAELAAHFTVVSYDRRGRGESGDVQPYAPAREVEDLAALIEAIGGTAALAAGSGGCTLSLDAATALPQAVRGLYLFDPPFIVGPGRPPVPADWGERAAALVAEGRRGDAVELFMTEVVGVPAEFLEPMKADPSWAAMEQNAHTLRNDALLTAGLQDGTPLPADRWRVPQPVTVVVGENSEPFLHEAGRALADLLDDVRYETLPGQDHGAFWVVPGVVAESAAVALGATRPG